MLTRTLTSLQTGYVLIAFSLVNNCWAQAAPNGNVENSLSTESVRYDSTEYKSTRTIRPFFVVEASLTNIYESNINHDDDDVDSRGLIPGGTIKIQNRKSKPTLELEYRIASHQYTNTSRWNRISNFIALSFSPRLSKRVYTETQTEISLKGSSEDRDLSDQYQIRQEVEYRLAKSVRIHLYGTLRRKRYPNPIDNSFKPNTGSLLELRLPRSRAIEFEARHEVNIEKEERGRYDRQTVEFKYERPAIIKNAELELKLKRRWKNYDRLIETEQDGEVVEMPRRDQQTSLGLELSVPFSRKLKVVMEYEYEWRRSNDVDKLYNAHAAGASLTVRV
jgi:hypothetical protein